MEKLLHKNIFIYIFLILKKIKFFMCLIGHKDELLIMIIF